jgi:hypothetical protein
MKRVASLRLSFFLAWRTVHRSTTGTRTQLELEVLSRTRIKLNEPSAREYRASDERTTYLL